jgi:hypothetical protein
MSSMHTALASMLFTVAMSAYAQQTNPDSAPDLVQQGNRVDQFEHRIQQLESDVNRLKSENRELERTQSKLLEDSGNVGVVLFLFGVFCALWAQNTRRNAWLWFFLGLFFNIITVLVLLNKNVYDRRNAKP